MRAGTFSASEQYPQIAGIRERFGASNAVLGIPFSRTSSNETSKTTQEM